MAQVDPYPVMYSEGVVDQPFGKEQTHFIVQSVHGTGTCVTVTGTASSVGPGEIAVFVFVLDKSQPQMLCLRGGAGISYLVHDFADYRQNGSGQDGNNADDANEFDQSETFSHNLTPFTIIKTNGKK
jgi:hypothetical protein